MYREERARQEASRDEITGMYDGDTAIWRENGEKLVTFKDWLIASKGSSREKENWERDEKRAAIEQIDGEEIAYANADWTSTLYPATGSPSARAG